MLIQEKSYTRHDYFKYTKGELHLAFVKDQSFFKEPMWMFEKDVKDKSLILESKAYTFGDRYGILSKKEENASRLNIRGTEWFLVTLSNGKPILKDSNPQKPDKTHPKYLRLKEIK